MELEFTLSIAVFFVLFFLLVVRVVNPTAKKAAATDCRLPPGPWKLPLIGNLHQMVTRLPQHRALGALARKHGPLMHLQLGQVSVVVASSPEMAEQVLKTHDLALADRPEALVTKIMFYDKADIAFSPYGGYWKQMRKICVNQLLSPKKLLSFRYTREDEAFRVVESIRSSAEKPINLSEKIGSYTSSITCRAMFGRVCKDQDALLKLMTEAVLMIGNPDITDLFPSMQWLHVLTGRKNRLQDMHRKVDEVLENLIDEHVRNNNPGGEVCGNGESGEEDLVDVLLRLKQNSTLDFPITSTSIKAVAFDMFTAGSETSMTTIEWAMAEMMRHPRIMEKAQVELRQKLGKRERIFEHDVQGLDYLKMVVKETLRQHPPGPLLVPRECREECEIGQYKIPIKSTVLVNAWACGRDPKYWHDPESFKPERFLNSPINFNGNYFEYIPFGAGRRICPGISLGIAEVELLLAHLLYHFDWELSGGIKPEELDMAEECSALGRKREILVLVAKSYASLFTR